MISKTKGIVLRTVKYGETSVVVTIFTELFGLQSYLVNGVRASNTNPKLVVPIPVEVEVILAGNPTLAVPPPVPELT